MTKSLANKELAEKIDSKLKGTEPAVHMKHWQKDQVAITRQSSLKSAAAIISGFRYNSELEAQEATIKMAEAFESWVLRP